MNHGERIGRLGAQIASLVEKAKGHDAKAAICRRKVLELTEQFNQLVAAGARIEPSRPRRAPRRKPVGGGPQEASATDQLRDWAFKLGRDFAFGEARTFLKTINASTGPFYHLVKRGDLERCKHGLYRHVDIKPPEEAVEDKQDTVH